MARVTINVHKSNTPTGGLEMHYGYVCEVGPEGQLFADVPEDMLQNELANKRVTLLNVTAVTEYVPPSELDTEPVTLVDETAKKGKKGAV